MSGRNFLEFVQPVIEVSALDAQLSVWKLVATRCAAFCSPEIER
ncbi:MAG: hypothetical protein RIS69_793 [Actinomycetota bacterium]